MMARKSLIRRGLCLLAPVLLTAGAAQAGASERVVSVGGAVTEIIYALGQQDRLIARDTTSSYPEAALELPDIGYARALSPEGVLSVGPDMIIATDGAGPPETLDVLKEAGVAYVSVPEDYSAEGVAAKIRAVGAALDQEAEAEALAQETLDGLAAAQAGAAGAAGGKPKRVLFILSTQGGRIMAGGTGTAADGIIRMAGGVNAVSGFEGYKQMTDEAVLKSAPDVILAMDRGGDHETAREDTLALPALRPTPAAESGSLIRMDGLHLLGFGPRTASAVEELARAIYGGKGTAGHGG